ncbi:MAG TPA: family 16 glycoside hydrolase [Chthonomonadales bacterium]|nr:family 16 glycoside hydrolase [Chthonomonadales bacterium]
MRQGANPWAWQSSPSSPSSSHPCRSAPARGRDRHLSSPTARCLSRRLPGALGPKGGRAGQAFRISFRQPRLGADGTVTEKARVTVHWNGILVIDRKEVDGVTGGELDRAEGTPGPIMLQGDHGPILYRNIRIRPVPSQPAR